MSYESEYVKRRREDSIRRFDEEMEKRKFRRMFENAIRDGMTIDDFRAQYQHTDHDLDLFRRIQAEVCVKNKLGEDFVTGFTNPGYRANRKRKEGRR